MAFAFSQIRKSIRIGVSAAVLLTVGCAVWGYLPLVSGPARDAWTVPAPTDELWTVRTVLREITRFVAFGSRQDSDLWKEDAMSIASVASEKGRSWFRVQVRYGAGKVWETQLCVPAGAIAEAEPFLPFTRELMSRVGVEAPPYSPLPPYSSPLLTLAIPRPEVFQQENARISDWLQQAPLDARAHAEAALLLATLGWRESSGAFRDPRDLCHRAQAHLVLAQALRHEGSPSDTARVAELMLGLVIHPGADHERRMRRLAVRAVAEPLLNPWISTAEMVLGRDWHAVAEADNPTLLERIELFRAMCRQEGPSSACVQLSRRQFEDVADWTRIVFENQFSIGEGRRFVKYALPFETEETVKIFPELAGHPVQSAAFAKVLNTAVEPAVSGENMATAKVTVIDAGLWGHYLQRHLCHVICRTGDHLRAVGPIPEAAPAFCQSMAVVYRHLKLVPMAAVEAGDSEWLHSAAPAVAALLRQHPDWVTENIWSRFLQQGPPEMTRDLPPVAQRDRVSKPIGE